MTFTTLVISVILAIAAMHMIDGAFNDETVSCYYDEDLGNIECIGSDCEWCDGDGPLDVIEVHIIGYYWW